MPKKTPKKAPPQQPQVSSPSEESVLRGALLKSQFDLAKRQMNNGGTVLAIDLAGGRAAADQVMAALQLVRPATSLGGPETLMIGRVLWDEFFSNNDWPRASAVAVVMILLIIVPLAIFNKYEAEQLEGKKR